MVRPESLNKKEVEKKMSNGKVKKVKKINNQSEKSKSKRSNGKVEKMTKK